jgi:hypothetical protein
MNVRTYAVYSTVYWRKFTIERQEKLEQKFDTSFGKALELVSVFKEASRNFIFIFSLKQGRQNI